VRSWWERAMGFAPAAPDLVVERTITLPAPMDAVWRHVADHASMGAWWPDASFELSTEGEDVNGPGAVRLVRSGRRVLDEQVVGWERGRRMDYRLRAGAPLRYHFGRVELRALAPSARAAMPASTSLTWRIRFRPRFPATGWLLRLVIARMLRRALFNLEDLLRRESERVQRGAT